MQKVDLPLGLYVLMFFQLVLTGYIAIMLRDGITLL